MTPAEQAAKLWQATGVTHSFRECLEAHLLHGWVISTPEVFVMARTCSITASDEALRDPWYRWHPDDVNGLYVYAMAGSLQEVFNVTASFLTRSDNLTRVIAIGWHRVGRDNLRFYDCTKILSYAGRR